METTEKIKYIKNPELPYHRATAQARCCGDTIISNRGGYFESCKCGKSFIDQERFDARWVRLGGEADLVSAECPTHCKLEEHQ